ncbi:MAG: hypothetical protein AAB555_00740, partial [Patescibacteria group bacterium]
MNIRVVLAWSFVSRTITCVSVFLTDTQKRLAGSPLLFNPLRINIFYKVQIFLAFEAPQKVYKAKLRGLLGTAHPLYAAVAAARANFSASDASFIRAAGLGFEPRYADPESAVL